ncbi:MAG: tetratricopeptide repeat protein [Vicinamibacterales bacterium]
MTAGWTRSVAAAACSCLLLAPFTVAAQGRLNAAPDADAVERAADASALEAIQAERWDDALTATLQLVARVERPAYLTRLADIYHHLHRPADEIAAWERFMAIAPEPARACPMIGRAYRGLGEFEHAVDAFARCLASEPGNVTLVYFLGLGHEWAGALAHAREIYERAIAMAPPGYDYEVSIARLDLHQGNLTAARDRAVAVLARVPAHVEGALVAGLAEQRAGRRQDARRFLELAARLSPEYFDVRLALGILDYTDSRTASARGHFEAAFLADPSRRAEVQPWLDRTAGPK